MLTFSFNANSADVNFDSTIISSAEIEAGIDPKKKKITVKNAEVKFDDGSIYNGPIKKNKMSGKGKLTLNDGTVTFDFTDSYNEGQAGFAVLDIEVNGSFKGVIMIEEMKTNKKTVYL